jgi:hypothetical protein
MDAQPRENVNGRMMSTEDIINTLPLKRIEQIAIGKLGLREKMALYEVLRNVTFGEKGKQAYVARLYKNMREDLEKNETLKNTNPDYFLTSDFKTPAFMSTKELQQKRQKDEEAIKAKERAEREAMSAKMKAKRFKKPPLGNLVSAGAAALGGFPFGGRPPPPKEKAVESEVKQLESEVKQLPIQLGDLVSTGAAAFEGEKTSQQKRPVKIFTGAEDRFAGIRDQVSLQVEPVLQSIIKGAKEGA